MLIRKIVLATAAVAALSPAVSNAGNARTSLKACANAFASSLASPGATAPAFKVDYREGLGNSFSDYYPTDYTFTLEAHNPKSGAAIARARCSTNTRGVVTEIATLPLETKVTTLAAR